MKLGNHESVRTTGMCDHSGDELTADEKIRQTSPPGVGWRMLENDDEWPHVVEPDVRLRDERRRKRVISVLLHHLGNYPFK